MVIGLLYLFGWLLLIHGSYQLFKYFVVMSRIEKAPIDTTLSNKSVEKNMIFVLAPVLHEEKNIERLVKGLSRQKYPERLYAVYFITTEKEYSCPKKPNTIEILDRLEREGQLRKFQAERIHYPFSSGFKADQLEYALEKIKNDRGKDEVSKSFFLFLDADSEISENTLLRFNASIEDNIEIYQEPLLWFRNIQSLRDPLMISFAFLQSFFSVSYEIPMFSGWFIRRRLKYLIGPGMFIRGSFLLSINTLPAIIEDVRLGRLSSFMDADVKLVPGFGIVETAKNFFVYVKQVSVWFFGCGLFVSDYINVRKLKRYKINLARDVFQVSYGFFKAFRWLNKGLIHLIGLVVAVIYSDVWLGTLFTTSLLFNSSLPVFFVGHDFNYLLKTRINNVKKRTRVLLTGIIFSPVLYMLNFIGTYYGLIKLVKFYIWGKVSLPKTER